MNDNELDALMASANPVSESKTAALDVKSGAEDLLEAIMSETTTRSYKRLGFAGVAVAAVAAIAIGVTVIDSERGAGAEVLQLVLASTNRSEAKLGEEAAMSGVGAPAADRMYWQPTEYSIAESFEMPTGSSTVWEFTASKSERDDFRARASEAIQNLGGTPNAEHIWSDDYEPYYWSYSDYAQVAVSSETRAEDGASGGGTSGSSGGSVDPGVPVSEPEPAVVDCSLYPKDPGCYYEEPKPPVNVPNKDEADDLGRQFFEDLGLDLSDYQVDAYADDWGAYVSAYLVVNGHNTWMGWNIGFGENAEVTYAGGVLSSPRSLGEYPLADRETVLTRLNEYQSVMPMLKDGLEYTSDAAVDSSLVGPPETLTPPEVRKVELVRAELGLTQFYDVNGRLLLVPAFDLYSEAGLEVTILAVAKEFVDENTPDDAQLPGVDTPTDTAVPPTEPVTSVDPVPGDFEPIPQEDADKLLGLNEEEASKVAAGNDWIVRIVARDGEFFQVTSDYVTNRVNLEIVDGVVMAVSVG